MKVVRKPTSVMSGLAFALVAMFLLTRLSSAGLLWLLNRLCVPMGPWLQAIISNLPLYVLGLPVFTILLRRVPDGPAQPPVRLSTAARMTPARFLALLVLCHGGVWGIARLTELLAASVLPLQLRVSGTAVAGLGIGRMFLFEVLLPAVGEEYIFRFLLYKKLQGAGDKVYIIFSALAFALFHGQLLQLPYALFAGALFAWVYARTRNLLWPVLLHGLHNALSGTLPRWLWSLGWDIDALAFESLSVALAFESLSVALAILAVPLAALVLCKAGPGLAPPAENGWPYKQPGRWRRWLAGAGVAASAAPQALPAKNDAAAIPAFEDDQHLSPPYWRPAEAPRALGVLPATSLVLRARGVLWFCLSVPEVAGFCALSLASMVASLWL